MTCRNCGKEIKKMGGSYYHVGVAENATGTSYMCILKGGFIFREKSNGRGQEAKVARLLSDGILFVRDADEMEV